MSKLTGAMTLERIAELRCAADRIMDCCNSGLHEALDEIERLQNELEKERNKWNFCEMIYVNGSAIQNQSDTKGKHDRWVLWFDEDEPETKTFDNVNDAIDAALLDSPPE